jgi:tetratricopeptide (TPR) repeat protein
MGSKKGLVAGGLVVLILAVAGGVVWYVSVPHSAEEQFARAEKLEKDLRSDAKVKTPEQVAPQTDETIQQYRKVAAWGKPEKTVEALKRIEKIEEEVAQSDSEALKVLDEIIKDFPQEENAGEALMDEARLIRKDADNLKSGKPADAAPRYKDELAKLDDYLKRFPGGKLADAATMEKGRVWQDGLGDPLINAIDIFEKFRKDFASSDYMDEALYRLGKLYQYAKEYEKAMALYGELTEKYPKSPWAEKATLEKGKILAKIMDKQKEAAKEFEDFQKKYPNSPLRGEAAAGEKSAREASAREDHEQYGKSRYGGTVPYDTASDKAMPPAGMFKIFALQKLHAKKYNIDVTFAPADHGIAVKGTLDLVNNGDDKTTILLMLSQAMDVSACTVDGKPAKQELVGQKWTITLPAVLKKDGAATIGFEYAGHLAGPMPELPGHHHAAASTAPSTEPATQPEKFELEKDLEKMAKDQEAKGDAYPMDPQLALGDYGYGLSGGAWYPITIIGDLFDAHVTMHTPAGIEAVTNGEPEKRDPDKGEFVFDTRHPVFGLYFAYGKYTVHEKTIGKIKYFTYLKERNAGKTDAYTTVASNILNFYSDKFVPFPYEKLAIVEVPLPPFLGGVGPASLMFLHQNMVAQKDPPEFLLAHELAHQWFGNLVPINMIDPRYNQWLSEGFATYCDALYEEKGTGPEAMAHHMERYGQLFFQMSLMFPRGQQAIKNCYPSSPLYRPVVYEKGALVLHALRKVLGDDKFFAVMRKYVETYHDKLTTVDDFRHLAAEVAGQDLSWFFSEWIDQGIYAHWTFTNVTIGTPAKAGDPVKVTLSLQQPDDLIKMPVDITYLGEKKEERYVQENVMLDQIDQTVEATVPFKPVKIIIDEQYWVLHTPQRDNIWPAEKEDDKTAAKVE